MSILKDLIVLTAHNTSIKLKNLIFIEVVHYTITILRPIMQAIIESYNIDYEQLRLFLSDYNGFIAGSSALAAYLTQENIQLHYEPGDIDIWIPSESSELIQLFQEFIRFYGFTNSYEYDSLDITSTIDYENISNIHSVTSFLNSSNKKIQLIIIDMDVYSETPYNYIHDHFDISICATWWEPDSYKIRTLDPYNTNKQRMYILNDKEDTISKERIQKRLEKYKERGFKYITSQPLIYKNEDPRIFRTDTCTVRFATDIITFEDDINVKNYLEQSHENIIIKSGTELYTFTRKYITEYMRSKSEYIINNNRESGFICTTPFNQTILMHDLNYIDYSDYSIYELIYSHLVHYNGKAYSVCKMICYSVADWEKNIPTRICHAPYADLIPLNATSVIRQVVV